MIDITFVGANQVYQDPAITGGPLHISTAGIDIQEFDLVLLCVSGLASGPGFGWTAIPSAGKTRVYWMQSGGSYAINASLALEYATDAIMAVYRGAQVYDGHSFSSFGSWGRIIGAAMVSFNPIPGTVQGCYVLTGQSDAPQTLDPLGSPTTPFYVRKVGPSSQPGDTVGKHFLADSDILYPGAGNVGPYSVDLRSPVSTVAPGRGGAGHAFVIPPAAPYGNCGMSLQRRVACVPGDALFADFYCNEDARLYPQGVQSLITTWKADGISQTGSWFGAVAIGGGWRHMGNGFTAPADTAFVGLDIVGNTGSGETGDLLLDDISLMVNGVEQLTVAERQADGPSGSGPPGTLDEWDNIAWNQSACSILLEQLADPWLDDPDPDHGVSGQTILVHGFRLGITDDIVPIDFLNADGSDWLSTTGRLLNAGTVRVLVPPGVGTGPIRFRNLIGMAYSRIDWFRQGAGGWLIGAVGFPGAGGSPRRYPANLVYWRASTFEEMDSAANIQPISTMFSNLGDINASDFARQGKKALDVWTSGGGPLEFRTWPPHPLALSVGDPIQMTGMISHAEPVNGVHLYVEFWLGGVIQGVASLETGRTETRYLNRPPPGWDDVLQEMSPSLAPVACDSVALHVILNSGSSSPFDTIDRLGLFVEHGLTVNDWTPGP